MEPIEAILEEFKLLAMTYAALCADQAQSKTMDIACDLTITAMTAQLQSQSRVLKNCTDIPAEKHLVIVGTLIALTRDKTMKQPAIIEICREILAVHAPREAQLG